MLYVFISVTSQGVLSKGDSLTLCRGVKSYELDYELHLMVNNMSSIFPVYIYIL